VGTLEDKPSFSESPLEPTLSPSQLRLEHYEILAGEGGGAMAAKIIDLGLAKPATESACDAGISARGAFAGTPEFASPEQFAGLGADIRSDLYSLGIVLWEMLTGRCPSMVL